MINIIMLINVNLGAFIAMYKTAETVSPGHPDKIADLISDYVLTEALSNDNKSRVAVETFLTGTSYGGLVVVGGEISDIAKINDKSIEKIVKNALAKTIKTSFEDFQLDNLKIQNELTPQSEEIRSAVEDDEDLGAGDQGIMVGYATNETNLLCLQPLISVEIFRWLFGKFRIMMKNLI